MVSNRKVAVFIAASLDGYIAQKGDDMSFLSLVTEEGEDYGYGAFSESADTVIMGRRTYDWVMTQVSEFPHANKESFIVTRTPRIAIGNTQFYTGDIAELITMLRNKPGKTIFIDGGAEIVNSCIQQDLVDEYIISIIPILLGGGIRLFKDGRPEHQLSLINSKQFKKGLVQLHFARKQH